MDPLKAHIILGGKRNLGNYNMASAEVMSEYRVTASAKENENLMKHMQDQLKHALFLAEDAVLMNKDK
jgi:hypothetical protein